MDESAEQIAAAKAGRRRQRRRIAAVRREQLESAVWPVLVVMAPVDAEHVLEMAAAEDEDPVEAVGASCAHVGCQNSGAHPRNRCFAGRTLILAPHRASRHANTAHSIRYPACRSSPCRPGNALPNENDRSDRRVLLSIYAGSS